MDKKLYDIEKIVAMVCITALIILCTMYDINGTLITLGFGVIAGLAGYSIGCYKPNSK